MNQPKILFFIKDAVPTEAEIAEASEIVGKVVFRNASIKCEFPEACDGVAGAVPDIYKQAPTVEPEVKAPKAAKPPKAPKVSVVEIPATPQTPLIPAETGWTANS